MDELYTKEVMKHFRNPKNMGAIKNPDGEASVGNPVCGDVMKLYIKVKTVKNKEYISDIKFQTLGCGAAIACSSALTSAVKNKSLEHAKKISKATIVKNLGGLPATKIHCSILAVEALKKAIKNYNKKQ